MRVEIESKKHIYIHNDLANGADHLLRRIKTRLESSDHKGIAFDYMACLILLAFTFEAYVNFLGSKLIPEWQERKPFKDKIDIVLAKLEFAPDRSNRPFCSIEKLKTFRDLIAHGKPVEEETKTEAELPVEEFQNRALDGKWAEYCTPENVFETSDDVEKLWREMLARSGLDFFDTCTHGTGSIKVVEP